MLLRIISKGLVYINLKSRNIPHHDGSLCTARVRHCFAEEHIKIHFKHFTLNISSYSDHSYAISSTLKWDIH